MRIVMTVLALLFISSEATAGGNNRCGAHSPGYSREHILDFSNLKSLRKSDVKFGSVPGPYDLNGVGQRFATVMKPIDFAANDRSKVNSHAETCRTSQH